MYLCCCPVLSWMAGLQVPPLFSISWRWFLSHLLNISFQQVCVLPFTYDSLTSSFGFLYMTFALPGISSLTLCQYSIYILSFKFLLKLLSSRKFHIEIMGYASAVNWNHRILYVSLRVCSKICLCYRSEGWGPEWVTWAVQVRSLCQNRT